MKDSLYPEIDAELYLPEDNERNFVNNVWATFQDMYELRVEPLDILGGRTLQDFWDKSNYDYNVITEVSDENDPVVEYSSSISRDKADTFIGQLVSQVIYPNIVAQNQDQQIDNIFSKVGRSTLEWLYNNDGYPSESGHQKLVRYIHKMVVEGTMHTLDIVSKDGLESELVPNEEIFIPNFWQPNIQKQSIVIRAKLNTTYQEQEQIFGHLKNWKYVQPMSYDNFLVERPEFKEFWEGILDEDTLQVLYIYRQASKKELEELKKKDKIKKNCKRACFYNVVINNVPMYDIDKVLDYKDGYYPINKGIFAMFSKPEFYWGNSLPNKIKEDKAWIDAWKTLLRYKAKLNVLKPLVSRNGELIDEEIIMPAKLTPLPDGVELETIDGIGEPINNGDMAMMEMAEAEIERGAKAPQTNIDPSATARAAVIQESNAKILLNNFALQIIFYLSARTYLILTRAFEKLPRRTINKIAIPDQPLRGGEYGTLEVIFEKIPKYKLEEMDRATIFAYIDRMKRLKEEEKQAKSKGKPKNVIYVDPVYAENINLYCKFEPGTDAFGKDELKTAQFNKNLQVYLGRPDLFNVRKVAQKFIQYNKDDADLLNDEQPVVPPQMAQQPQGAGSELETGQQGKTPNLPQL